MRIAKDFLFHSCTIACLMAYSGPILAKSTPGEKLDRCIEKAKDYINKKDNIHDQADRAHGNDATKSGNIKEIKS